MFLVIISLFFLMALILFAFWIKTELRSFSLQKAQSNQNHFLELTDATLKPIKESMKELNELQRDLEKRREGAYSALSKQIEGLILSEKELRAETLRLSQALQSPQIRGSWGEVHLRRVVELAGLLDHCDFLEQKNISSEGRVLRPDLVIHLPNERKVAVDAKTPLRAYLEAAEVQDDRLYREKLQEHALNLKKHMKELSLKEYWKQFDTSLEYVILFLPAEAFFSAALQADPGLIEMGATQNIIVATPTTLIAILRAIAHGWRQESLSKSASQIAEIGEELYDRLLRLSEYWNRVGKTLNQAVDAYNQSVASFESRVLVSARKLKETGSFSKELPQQVQIEKITRSLEPLMEKETL